MLENDAAADVVGYWNEFVAHGRSVDPDFWTAERICDLLRPSYLRPASDADLADVDRAAEILAIGVMFLQSELTLPTRLVDLLARAANAQLAPARLREWGSDARCRRAALDALLTRIGRTRAPGAKEADPDKLELKQWRVWSKDYPRWVHSAMALVADDRWNGVVPPLVRHLEVLVRHKEGNQELGGASDEVVKHRLMAIAFRLGVFLELPEEEILQLIALAEEGKGEIHRRLRNQRITTLRDKLGP